jgi:acyl carrier protein
MILGKGRQVLTTEQEFSIEIPDKEADAIHSGM